MRELLIPLLEFPARYLYHLLCFLLGWFLTVSLPRFVMRQDVFLCLLIQYDPVVSCTADGFNPISSRVYYLNSCGSSLCAARDQHLRQAYG